MKGLIQVTFNRIYMIGINDTFAVSRKNHVSALSEELVFMLREKEGELNRPWKCETTAEGKKHISA